MSMPAPAPCWPPATADERGRKTPTSSCPRCGGSAFSTRNTAGRSAAARRLYPAGLLLTGDGGRSWQSLPATTAGRPPISWPQAWARLAGPRGALAAVREGRMQVLRAEGAALPAVAQLRLSRAGPGWLAGDGGLVQRSDDLGATWRGPPGNLPAAAAQFDFAALAVSGPEVWIAGSPGSRVFHSADAGRSWAAFATGSLLPLRAMTFVDNRHGWAVGEVGTVLATGDGGQTWRLQRCGGTRVALLVLAAEPHDVPLELVARAAGNDGYRTAVAVVGRRDLESCRARTFPWSIACTRRLSPLAARRVPRAWQFPLRQAGLGFRPPQIVEDWRRAGRPRWHGRAARPAGPRNPHLAARRGTDR